MAWDKSEQRGGLYDAVRLAAKNDLTLSTRPSYLHLLVGSELVYCLKGTGKAKASTKEAELWQSAEFDVPMKLVQCIEHLSTEAEDEQTAALKLSLYLHFQSIRLGLQVCIGRATMVCTWSLQHRTWERKSTITGWLLAQHNLGLSEILFRFIKLEIR